VKLGDIGEFGFIDRIAQGCLVGEPSHVVRGIGDDAAVVRCPHGLLLITTDLLIERVHFLRPAISPTQLGTKALAVNLSDIAAMGGTPCDAFVSIAIPAEVPVEELDGIYDGMKALARRTGVNILGGDTTRSSQDLCLNLVVTGFVPEGEALYRSGARVGDRIVVTGTLGDSAGGLRILLERLELPHEVAAPLLAAHLEPELYLEEARLFATSGWAHAAIDLSDGLASDLGHVCRASGVGAVVDVAALPLSAELGELCRAAGGDPLALALGGGEDYRLLVAVAPEGVEPLTRSVAAATGRRLYEIGEVVPGSGIRLRHPDGRLEPLTLSGFDHFAHR